MDKNHCLKLISENYNRVYLTDKGTILKCFCYRDFYTTEKKIYLILEEHGFPFSVRLLSFDDTTLWIELEYYPHDLNYYRDVRFYLKLLSYFDDIPLKNLSYGFHTKVCVSLPHELGGRIVSVIVLPLRFF